MIQLIFSQFTDLPQKQTMQKWVKNSPSEIRREFFTWDGAKKPVVLIMGMNYVRTSTDELAGFNFWLPSTVSPRLVYGFVYRRDECPAPTQPNT